MNADEWGVNKICSFIKDYLRLGYIHFFFDRQFADLYFSGEPKRATPEKSVPVQLVDATPLLSIDLTGFQRDRSLGVVIRFYLNRTVFSLHQCFWGILAFAIPRLGGSS